MKTFYISVIACFISFCISSCCVILSGKKANVTLEGDIPEPIIVKTDCKEYATTNLPIKVEVKRGDQPSIIQITSPNYVYKDIIVYKKFNTTIFWNFTNLFYGFWIDMATASKFKPIENMYKLDYEHKVCRLESNNIAFKESTDIEEFAVNRNDFNENPCAIIKVIATDLNNYMFEGNIIGNIVYKNSVAYIFVPEGTRNITIINDYMGTLKYEFPLRIKANVYYELRINK